MVKTNLGCMMFIAMLVFGVWSRSYAQATAKFGVAGYENDSIFTNFYQKFQAAVDHGDSSYIAALIEYPIAIPLGGKKPVTYTYKDSIAFLSHYSQIFNKRLRQLILSTPADSLFVNSNGVMLGSGQIWFYYVENKKGQEKTIIGSIENYYYLYLH